MGCRTVRTSRFDFERPSMVKVRSLRFLNTCTSSSSSAAAASFSCGAIDHNFTPHCPVHGYVVDLSGRCEHAKIVVEAFLYVFRAAYVLSSRPSSSVRWMVQCILACIHMGPSLGGIQGKSDGALGLCRRPVAGLLFSRRPRR